MTEHANASDLVKRLRQQSWCGPLHIEAADEIERLTGVAAFQDGCIKACHQEIGRLREKVEILEAEIRVMRQLPDAINRACEQSEKTEGK